MIRKNLLKATLITTIIATLFTATACGKKNNNNTVSETTVTVNAETKSIASKELTRTGLVTFDYTDENGNTVRLEGKVVASEDGDATIEVTDAKGNKAVFTGKAKTVDGKLIVSDIKVKEAGLLEKSDGTQLKVTEDAKIEDAKESDGNETSDVAATDEMKQEISNAKEEEKKIEEAREEVKNTEASNVASNNGNNENGNNNNAGDNNSNNNAGNAGDDNSNNNGSDSGNSSDNGNSGSNDNDGNGGGGTVTPTDPVAPDPTPTPTEPEPTPSEPATPGNNNDDKQPSADDPSTWGTIDGPNGPQYSENSFGNPVRGQDVNQGADVPCPYELEVAVTRYAYNNQTDRFENLTGFYYIPTNSEGDMSDEFYDLTERYEESHGWAWKTNTMYKIGTFSCGEVWFYGLIPY